MAQVVKKQYVSKGGEWVEVAGGGGGDFVPLAGGVDVGPGNLGVVGPTLLTHAARWADGTPRFATAAARDTAYQSIGGAQEGMRSYVAAEFSTREWDGTMWQWVSTRGGNYVLCNPPESIALAPGNIEVPLFIRSQNGPAYTLDSSGTKVVVPEAGIYHVSTSVLFACTGGGDQLAQIVGTGIATALPGGREAFFGRMGGPGSVDVTQYGLTGSLTMPFVAGDTIGTMISIGGTGTLEATRTHFSVHRLG